MDKTSYNPEDFYQIPKWGHGHFKVNEKGNLCVLPERREDGPRIDITEVIAEIEKQKIALPAVIRFNDILHSRVKEINLGFTNTIKEAEYEGKYRGVYPIKVNQMREVVEEILDAGADYNLGIEAGSKPELIAALALNENPEALTILNGYKDDQYLTLAMMGRKLGRKVLVVIEKFSEIQALLRISKEMKVRPLIGIRAKISVRGAGKWSESGGEKAKFGLSVSEILKALEILEEEQYLDCVKLLHFHIGSQVTTIQSFKDAVTESARIYAKLYQKGVPLEYFDVGGGLGVDYVGSKTSSVEYSMNYTTDEYINDVVYGLKQICDMEKVPHPTIVSESGRALTAHHSCIVTKVMGEIDPYFHESENFVYKDDHILVKNMRESLEDLSQDTFQEVYNDALAIKEDAISAFKLGVLSLEERAKIETMFGKVSKRISQILDSIESVPEDMQYYKDSIAKQYLCNFSVFQSLPDVWAINQVIPIVPISRLNEFPTERCTLVDITCDSDGKIDRFIENDESEGSLRLHKLKKDKPYHIGFFLTGAYQDVMGDMHNLFGRLNEVHVYCDDDDPDDFYIEEFIKGNTCKNVLKTMQYNADHLATILKKKFDKSIKQGKISPKEGVRLTDTYEEVLYDYTYLRSKK
ncbi:MAG: biosynthetic arginine decarboxylase [Bacteriovoracaceae bacterium]